MKSTTAKGDPHLSPGVSVSENEIEHEDRAQDEDQDPNEDNLASIAELLGFVMAGRPERIEDGMLATAPPTFRVGVREAREALASLAVCCMQSEGDAPSVELRARMVDSVFRRLPKRALVVIDMIHDHLDPGALLEVPRARDVVPALKKRIDDARARGVPVVYVVDEHDADDPDLDAWGTHAVKGTKGTEVWDEIAPQPGDLIVKKASYSAFFQSALGTTLESLNVDTLVLTGCLTEIGIMATATDAMQQGFVIEVPPDSQAGSSAEAETAAIFTMRVMAPFGPTRKARLDRVAQLAA